MLGLLQGGEADLVIGSRYVEGGSADSFNKQRAGFSTLATEVAQRVLKVKVADPMSGFFMIRRDRFEELAPQLSTQGFKILLDVVATARGSLRVREVPYTFGARLHGESKLDSMVALDFLGLVLAKTSLIKSLVRACPIVLLDEVAAHLDETRREALFGEILRLGAQAWMTGTDRVTFASLASQAQILGVNRGTISA